MKAVEITEATLVEYGRRSRRDTWVLTRHGRPVAAVVPIHPGVDLETLVRRLREVAAVVPARTKLERAAEVR